MRRLLVTSALRVMIAVPPWLTRRAIAAARRLPLDRSDQRQLLLQMNTSCLCEDWNRGERRRVQQTRRATVPDPMEAWT